MRGMLFIVTFDEGRGYSGGNHLATILLGDAVFRRAELLRITPRVFCAGADAGVGLGNLGQGDVHASTITGIWK